MRQRINQFICYILIFTMFVTGMSMETKMADSFFAYSTLGNHTCTSCIRNKQDTVMFEAACTQRMLGISQVSFLNRNIQHQRTESKLRTAFIIAIVSLCMISFAILRRTKENICVSNAYIKVRVLNYIHNQDGKK